VFEARKPRVAVTLGEGGGPAKGTVWDSHQDGDLSLSLPEGSRGEKSLQEGIKSLGDEKKLETSGLRHIETHSTLCSKCDGVIVRHWTEEKGTNPAAQLKAKGEFIGKHVRKEATGIGTTRKVVRWSKIHQRLSN